MKLSKKKLRECRKIFDKIDTNRNGKLTLVELQLVQDINRCIENSKISKF